MIRLVKRKEIAISVSSAVVIPAELGLPPLPSAPPVSVVEGRPAPVAAAAAALAATAQPNNPYSKMGRILSAYSAKELDHILQDCDGRQREILLASLLVQAGSSRTSTTAVAKGAAA